MRVSGYHTRWAGPRRASTIRADRDPRARPWQGVVDIRTSLGLSVAELALRAALTDDDIERIEEGAREPTIPLLRRLAAALT